MHAFVVTPNHVHGVTVIDRHAGRGGPPWPPEYWGAVRHCAGGRRVKRYDPEYHRRHSMRLPGYDYASPGGYFVTICTYEGDWSLGHVCGDTMVPSEWGRVVARCCHNLPGHFDDLAMDEFVVMPNHVHGIIVIKGDAGRGALAAPTNNKSAVAAPTNNKGGETPPLHKGSTLGQIVAYYKYRTTKEINLLQANPGNRVWQRGYLWRHGDPNGHHLYGRLCRRRQIL